MFRLPGLNVNAAGKLILHSLFFAVGLLFSGHLQAQKKQPADTTLTIRKNLSDEQLLDLVEKQTFRYFWDFGHPVSGMSRERSNPGNDYGPETVTTGGTGFGIMAIIAATERKWITREQALQRLLTMVTFLGKAEHYHGMFPHWMNGATGKTIPFSRNDDGADIVETSYLFQGLLCAKEYFNGNNPMENQLRQRISWLWADADWTWFTRGGLSMLFWHWSPNQGWKMNAEIRGWNECLITYVLAAASPTYSINADVYDRGWANSNHFKNGREYYGIRLALGFDYGGPLFFAHYSFLGIDPHGLKDKYADYWELNTNHVLINHKYCVLNPGHFKGYGEDCWGLTASDDPKGYAVHSPMEDDGVISPTAALASIPYTPAFSMKAMRHFYEDLGDRAWTKYGFVDAFSESENWFAPSHLAIDQGPIVVMIENYRSGLLWKLFMKNADVQRGLLKLGFRSPYLPGNTTID